MTNLVQQIPQLLSADQCTHLIDLSERFGFIKQRSGSAYPADIRHRVAIDDASISQRLWESLQTHLRPLADYFNEELIAAAGVCIEDYVPVGLNDRLRFYKYENSERFARHSDASFEKSAEERSLLQCDHLSQRGFCRGRYGVR